MKNILAIFTIFLLVSFTIPKEITIEEKSKIEVLENNDLFDSNNKTLADVWFDNYDEHFGFMVKAFPTAYGAGAFVTGGRGGVVLHVTNLQWNSNIGSLKWALEENYPRTIVFAVSGVINVTETLHWGAKGNVTIAGQTAPEGGITLYGDQIGFDNEDNIIIRYVKFRKPGSAPVYDWCMNIRQSTNIIVDNCSFAYSEEKALGIGVFDAFPTGNVTVQNNLFTECKDALQIGTSDSGNWQLGNYSVLNNVYSNVGWRCPVKIGGNLTIDVINNAVHNWQFKPIRTDADDWEMNLIGNYFQTGNQTRNWGNPDVVWNIRTSATISPKIWDEDTVWTIFDPNGYNYNPIPLGYPADKTLAWYPFDNSTEPIKSEWFVNSRLPLLGATPIILPSSQVLSTLLPIAGANKYLNADGTVGTYRDPIDVTAISNFENEVSYSYSTNWNSVRDNGLPTMPTNTRPAGYDTDGDGIPNVIEDATAGLDSNDANDGALTHSSGYSNLERYYLNNVDDVNPDNPVINTPSNISENAITFTWQAVANAIKYRTNIDNVTSIVTNGTTYNATNLTEDTSYIFTVESLDANDVVLGSSQSSARTSGSTTPPTEPTNPTTPTGNRKAVEFILRYNE